MFDELRGLQGQAFDLKTLVKSVNRQIAGAGFSSADERVSPRLDARSVRYYQTLGLVSKPDRYDGRQAVYGYQHLLQLVAIKALQAQGLSLGQIRGWLPDQPVAALQTALAGSLTGVHERGLVSPAAASAPRRLGELETALNRPALTKGSSEPSGLSAFRLAQGVDVLIDPTQVEDPASVARRLRASLDGEL